MSPEPFDFGAVADDLVRMIKSAYRLKRVNLGKDLKWKGTAELTQSEILCSSPPIAERIKAESLKFEQEDQGRSALDVIVCLALQLGIDQGLRMKAEEIKRLYEQVDLYRSLQKGGLK